MTGLFQDAGEEGQGQGPDLGGDVGVMSMADVAHECVLTIELMPRKQHVRVGHLVVDFASSVTGDVWVLSSPNHQHLRFDLARPVEGSIVTALA